MKVSNMNNEDRERDIQVMQIESLLLLESGKNDEALNLLEKSSVNGIRFASQFWPANHCKTFL